MLGDCWLPLWLGDLRGARGNDRFPRRIASANPLDYPRMCVEKNSKDLYPTPGSGPCARLPISDLDRRPGPASQRLAILDYAHRHGLTVQTLVEAQPSRHARARRGVDTLLEQVQAGTSSWSVSSRLGRSVGQIIQLVDRLLKQQVQLVAIKGGIPAQRHPGPPDEGDDHAVWLCGDRTRSHCRAHQRGLGRGPRPGPAAGRRKGASGRPSSRAGKRRSKASWRKRSQSVDRENSRGLPSTLHTFIQSRRLA